MSSNPPRCLLMDLGGVIISLDFRPLATKMRALTGIEAAQLQAMLSANGLVRKFESGQMGEREFHEEVCRRIGSRMTWEGFLDAWNSVFARQLIDDDLLASIAGRVRLWAISNTNKLHCDFLAKKFSFLRHFEGLVLSYEAGALKPDPQIFRTALERIQVPPSEVLFVDDLEENVEAAKAIGMASIRFENPPQLIAELKSRSLI